MDAVGVGALVAAMEEVDGLERHYFLVEDKAEEGGKPLFVGDLADKGGMFVGEHQLVIVGGVQLPFLLPA